MLYQLSYASFVERETGIGPATNSLEGCDSTTELLPQRKPLYQDAGLPATELRRPSRRARPARRPRPPYRRSTLKSGSSCTFTGACASGTLNVTAPSAVRTQCVKIFPCPN